MTRQEIEAKLRSENPVFTREDESYVTGDPEYEAKLTEWADEYGITLDNRDQRRARLDERENLQLAIQTFKDGDATNRQAQRAIAWLLTQFKNSEPVE